MKYAYLFDAMDELPDWRKSKLLNILFAQMEGRLEAEMDYAVDEFFQLIQAEIDINEEVM